MAEYIDRETVITSLEKLCDRVCHYSKAQRNVMCSSCPLGDAFTVIEDDIPPADVRPCVRGKWIKVGVFYTPGGDPVWECSECGKGRHVYGVEHGTYGADVSDGQWVACPNCGSYNGGDADADEED